MAEQEQVNIHPEKLMAIIGMKEVENVSLREQVAFLMERNAELVKEVESKKPEKEKSI